MLLTGIKIVDLSRILAGPFCTMLLADMGAEVVKIEPPAEGDPLRGQGAIKDGLSYYYASFNRNKKSITLDLYSQEGKEILASLIRQSDLVVDNFRPGVMAKMGFSYPRLQELNPSIIYCGITGFGATGPYKDRPAFDFIIQAMSGFMSLNNKEGAEPMRAAPPISDLIGGLYAAAGILAALFNRVKTGKGEEVQVALMDGLISFLGFMSTNFFATGVLPIRTGNDHAIVSPYGIFKASDGDLAIAPSNDQIYKKFIAVLGLTYLSDDPDFATNDQRMINRERIKAIIQEKIGTQTRDYWVDHLNRAGVPCGIIMNLKESFQDPQVLHQEMVLDVEHPGHGKVRMTGFPIKFDSSPCQIRMPAPRLGEHTEEILKSLNFNQESIKILRTKGVV
jgi:crotonobetainyl-CoA:carnitine CoA-transferase CaiB-like acyl-CoA transferase